MGRVSKKWILEEAEIIGSVLGHLFSDLEQIEDVLLVGIPYDVDYAKERFKVVYNDLNWLRHWLDLLNDMA